MFDDLRQQANQNTFEEPEEEQDVYAFREKKAPPRRLLGMTPTQRFIIALFLLLITCLLSTMCLLVMDKIYLPF